MSEIQTTDFDETAANNNAASPNGFPEGMAPSGVNDSARELMAQIKRFFNRITGRADAGTLISSAGVAPTFTVTFDTAPASLYTGLIVGFKAGADFGADPTLNVNALGAVNIQKMTSAGYANLISGDIKSGQHVWVKYDGTLAKWILLTPASSTLIDPMTTRGDIIVRNSSNVTARLGVGGANTVLKSDGTDPAYGKVTLSMEATGTAGNIRTYDASGNSATVAVGTSGQFLQTQGAGAVPQWANGVRVLDRTGTVVDVQNTTTKTGIYSVTVPGNTLGANGAVKITIIGTYTNISGAGATLTIDLSWGGTAFLNTIWEDTTASIASNATSRPVKIEVIIGNLNSTGAQWSNITVSIGNVAAATAGAGDLATAAFAYAVGDNFSGLGADTTSNQIIGIEVQHSVANANILFSKKYAWAEVM